MKRKLLLFITLLFNFSVFSQTTYYSRSSGNWNNVNTWSTVACGGAAATTFPLAGDDIVICSGNNISVNVNSDCNNVTIQGTGTLDFPTNNITLNTNGNVDISGTGGITALAGGGSATRVLNVAGTFNVANGASIVIGGLTLNVTGIVTTDGTITCTVNTGAKNFLSDFNINSTGALLFTQGETYTISGNLNMVNGSSIGGGATGTIIVNGMFNVLAGVSSASIGRASMTMNSSTNIDGTLLFATSASGNKSFRDINISATGV